MYQYFGGLFLFYKIVCVWQINAYSLIKPGRINTCGLNKEENTYF